MTPPEAIVADLVARVGSYDAKRGFDAKRWAQVNDYWGMSRYDPRPVARARRELQRLVSTGLLERVGSQGATVRYLLGEGYRVTPRTEPADVGGG